ncbi:PaaI family thioesterase [Tsukamurella sp. 8F]|uniref:PaaI family thioesterase n=1 Tax=unclassified Tsukamurella TaxID=2633480 RepID=UPI0023B97A29|nr:MULTISPECIES: PaaI family thioesterase [unclassified Tsukamurella]MDF0532469.1 PaaI family thioesterase [Tsukamurella sp. 8J]MDF0589330.1 PaaI family thioesterase [Tsukamurella sp. 8F]
MSLTTDDPLAAAREILAAQAFNTVVGAELTDFGDGRAELVLDIADHHRQQYGVVHGGVLAFLADNVVTFAAGSVLGTGVITAGVDVSYLRAARAGSLRAVGSVARHTARHAVCTAEIWLEATDSDPELCAIAQGTIFATSRT